MAECGFRELIDKFLDILFPPRCPGCGEVISVNAKDVFCAECRNKWEKHKKENCRKCGQPLDKCWCGVPFDKNGVITNEYHLVQYDKMANTVIRNLLYNMKNYNRSIVSDTVAVEMYAELYPRLDYGNLIIAYVPRSAMNIKRYGHDQSENIAYSFAKIAEIDVADVLVNTGKANQKKLDPKQRRLNAEKSYHIINGAGKYIKDKTVILIDDVLTTGATVTRCAHLLKWKGAKRVIVFTIARTI
ncbi:MAG: ComF family protein [Clostridia bacterium]|nr:ComF family protein [Clostridia bacterium]